MEHPITPPPELVEEWFMEQRGLSEASRQHIATQAARWGADQWLDFYPSATDARDLRAARRPKPPSLKEQALEAAKRFYAKGHEGCTDAEVKDDFDTIRRALEQLND